jgi:hypothetical protein
MILRKTSFQKKQKPNNRKINEKKKTKYKSKECKNCQNQKDRKAKVKK